ncbi:fimbrial assembly protein [Enterobacter sp. Cy-643]|uniref:CS1 type fimbrial major subunit n=1 Tax=Enterobacter sp. Cy-643 TaxID=2608346 RepID=UPI00141F1AE4|nr:CS1 type fimbrial major subunit [Enterobacter sp. Cy-643]NIF32826.1 fimbrial assembly protein [Enterobacter sp. Cy-643]
MCKKTFIASTMFAMTLVANAVAAPQVDFSIEAVIPDNSFYVTPLNGWDAKTQKMTWNEANSSLGNLTQQLQMKNANGGIKAYLSGQPSLSSSSSTDVIELDVVIAGQTLPTNSSTAVTLYDASAAANEKTATMTVSQKNAGTRPTAGNYLGAVTMMFDTVTP